MPIESAQPIVTKRVIEEAVTLNQLWVDAIFIDATKREDEPPKFAIRVTPFLSGNPSVFGAESIDITTANVYAVAQRFPSVAAAIGAIYVAVKDLVDNLHARQADLATAQAALAAANDAASAKANALTQAEDARNVAFASRTSPEDPIWTNADTAWQAAQTEAVVAQAAADTAAARVAIAQAAVADPANAPLA